MRALLLASTVLLTAFSEVLAAVSASAELPFEYRGGLLWVRVRVPQSPEPLNYLLDSGASASVINLGTAKRLGVKLGQRVDVRGVGSSAIGFWPQRLEAMAGAVSLPKDYLAVDLAELSRACDCGVDGLLGADFFRGRVVQIDFVASKIRLLPASDAADDASVVDLKRSRMALLAAVRVNDGSPQWMRVDTGCTSALQWVVTGARTPNINRAVSIALTKVNIPTASTTVTLGEMKFDSIPTGLHQRPIFSDESGLLGNGLLCKFERVTIDAKRGRLILENRRAGN